MSGAVVSEHGEIVDEREAKVRRELARLRADVASAKSKIRALTSVEGSPVAWNDPYADRPLPVALAGDTIRFAPSGGPGERGPHLDVSWRDMQSPSYLEVRTGMGLTVQPQSGNVIRIYITDWNGIPQTKGAGER